MKMAYLLIVFSIIGAIAITGILVSPALSADKKTGKKSGSEKQEREYWCKQGTKHKKNIEKAQQEISDTEKELESLKKEASMEIGNKRTALDKKIKKTEKKLREAKKELAKREKDLNILENEAHKKGIPPGWLRCQFD
jgi:peptidoglycan hydrolase CwlO-like protein